MKVQKDEQDVSLENIDEILHKYNILEQEANRVREQDKVIVKGLVKNFYNKKLTVGIGFQRAYGAILSGDYFDLIRLPNGQYLFVFADISGHGLPAYTTLIRLRSAITIAINNYKELFTKKIMLEPKELIRDISQKFTEIMEASNSDDFACVNFVFISNERDKYKLKFFNRSMLFPMVVRKFNNELVDVYNLNNTEKGWIPQKGYLLGKDLKSLLDDKDYFFTPECEFTIYEGDSILFYSDGIIEASRNGVAYDEFGEEKIEKILKENFNLFPQLLVDELFREVYSFIEFPANQKDDMTAVMINFPVVR